jgi:hypothetical protein
MSTDERLERIALSAMLVRGEAMIQLVRDMQEASIGSPQIQGRQTLRDYT